MRASECQRERQGEKELIYIYIDWSIPDPTAAWDMWRDLEEKQQREQQQHKQQLCETSGAQEVLPTSAQEAVTAVPLDRWGGGLTAAVAGVIQGLTPRFETPRSASGVC